MHSDPPAPRALLPLCSVFCIIASGAQWGYLEVLMPVTRALIFPPAKVAGAHWKPGVQDSAFPCSGRGTIPKHWLGYRLVCVGTCCGAVMMAWCFFVCNPAYFPCCVGVKDSRQPPLSLSPHILPIALAMRRHGVDNGCSSKEKQ